MEGFSLTNLLGGRESSSLEGCMEGSSLRLDGSALGTKLGTMLGSKLGIELGTRLGCLEGSLDGTKL